MRIFILTQNDNLYLPDAMSKVCEKFKKEIVCIVSAPATGGKGGAVRRLAKHVSLFGFNGTVSIIVRVLVVKIKDLFSSSIIGGKFYSLDSMARAFRVPFFKVKFLREKKFQEILDKYPADLLVSMSCPQIINKKIREHFNMGCINVHGSPLPRYRGLMPAFWVLRNGETCTASTVHDLAAKLDDGGILVQREVKILPNDTWDSLLKKTKSAGADALIEAIEQIRNGTVNRRPNREEEASYFSFPTGKDRKEFLALGRRFF